MSKVKILIVEDEFIVAHDMELQLKKIGYNVLATLDMGEKAIEYVNRTVPDLILMDINLGAGINGIEASEKILKTRSIPLIFVTAYSDQKTFQAARHVRPHAYIVKPFHFHNLVSAIEMALYNFSLDEKAELDESAKRIPEKIQSYLVNESVFLKNGDGFTKVRTDDIHYLEALGSYCKINTVAGEHLMCRNLQSMLEKISNPNIIRTHRSFAVNLLHIDRIESNQIFIDNKCIPVSRSYHTDVIEKTIKK